MEKSKTNYFGKIVNMFDKINIFVITGVLSAVIFVVIYGVKILDPFYVDWLYNGEDLTQHYLGWLAYRQSDWTFPIGMTNYLVYPDKSSVIFTDSIPLFAVIFKIFSPVLPHNFQYYGIWGIMCFCLQGIIAGKIIRHFTEKKVTILCGSMLAVISPVMIFRMFCHTALAGQWILLLALELLFTYEDNYKSGNRIYLKVAIIAMLASSVHIYFIAMCGIILAGVCLFDILCRKRFGRTLLLLSEYIAVSAFVVWILGGFSSFGSDFSSDGFGHYSMNLNSFLDSQEWLLDSQKWSLILPDLSNHGDGQSEGFAYLGLGLIILLIFEIISVSGKINLSGIREFFHRHWKKILSIALIVFISLIIAIFPVVTLGTKILFEIRLPQAVMNFMGIFRSTGRFAVIVVYILEFVSVYILSKIKKGKSGSVLISLCLFIQIVDISPKFIEIHRNYSKNVVYESCLKDPVWEEIGNSDKIKHVVMTFKDPQLLYAYDIGMWALNNDLTMNSFPVAHPDYENFEEKCKKSLNDPASDTVFIFLPNTDVDSLGYNLKYRRADGLIIGYGDSYGQ